MITCSLTGGIGNQLFQISATIALAIKNDDNFGFDFNQCSTPNQGYVSNKYKTNILSKIPQINLNEHKFNIIYNEPEFNFNEIPYSKNLLLNGYFQSEKYFIEYKNIILDFFNFKIDDDIKLYLSHIPKPITTIHIRRGDYLKNPNFHPILTLDYYKEAMSLFDNSNFIFVSDDMDWVRDNFKGNNIWYSPFNEIGDLQIMKLSDNNIIANSSFSWWGAYLNNNPNKKVIAPKKWFGPNGPKNTQDIIPINWITT